MLTVQRGANRARVRDNHVVRATGLQGDASVEIIDIIDDDINAFGNRAPSTTIHDTGGPRWIGPVAGAVLIALLLYGVASSASSSSAPKVAPAPSTSVAATRTTNTVPFTTTTTAEPPPVPYYAANPPRKFTVSYADIQHQVDESGYYGNGTYVLLATPGSTATSGSWFSIETVPSGQQGGLFATNAYRALRDQQTIAVSHPSAGQSMVQLNDNQAGVTLTSFGISDDDAVRLAESISFDGDNILFTDQSLVEGYQVLSSVYPWLAIQGIPIERVEYVEAHDAVRDISISVALRPPTGQGGDTLDRQTAIRFFFDHATPFDVDGHAAVAGAVIGDRDRSMATWIAGDHIVTIGANMPVQELMTIARTVHQVSAEEWNGMEFQATRNSGDNNFGNVQESNSLPVSFGTDTNAEPWVVKVGISTFGTQKMVDWGWDGFVTGFGSIDQNPTINTAVDDKRTYVLAELPRAAAATAQLQISRDGLDPVLVPFTDTDPTLDRTFAAYAFSEATQYTAQIIGADGTVLANWPSP